MPAECCFTILSFFKFQKVITRGISNPRGVAVYPTKGLLAYSNWDDNPERKPHIGLAGLDGDDVEILVETNLRWPNGLAFDMPSNRLFWGEAYYDLLESIRLDGTGRVSVKPNTNLMALHPFSVAVFENTIFWSDQSMREIQSCDKFTGEDHKAVVKAANLKVMGVHIIHELLEPMKQSPCAFKKCSHLCFLKRGGKEAVCDCPTGYEMTANGHECQNLQPSPQLTKEVHSLEEILSVTTTKEEILSVETTMVAAALPNLKSTTSSTKTTPTTTTPPPLASMSETATNSSTLTTKVRLQSTLNSTEILVIVVSVIVVFIVCCILIYCGLKKKAGKFKSPVSKRKRGVQNNQQVIFTNHHPMSAKLEHGTGREIYNNYEDLLDYKSEEGNPRSVSKSLIYENSKTDLMVDLNQDIENTNDKCQLITDA